MIIEGRGPEVYVEYPNTDWKHQTLQERLEWLHSRRSYLKEKTRLNSDVKTRFALNKEIADISLELRIFREKYPEEYEAAITDCYSSG